LPLHASSPFISAAKSRKNGLPRFFDPVETPAAFYSFTGALERPLQVIDGGYIT
jgi:hypothetical protein